MKIGRYLVVAVLAGAFGPAGAWSQALTSLQSVRVGYNTRKATVRPSGGTHGSVVAPNLPAVFDFFDAHKK